MREDTDVSVIICTRNRSSSLRQTLSALSAASVPTSCRYEVIVIDNASSDDTRAVIEAAAATMPVKYAHESRPGAGQARNTGLAQATGRLIFVIDDDCIVRPDWLDIGYRLLNQNPRQVIGGRIDLHDARDLPLTIKTDTDPASLTSVGSLLGFLHGCNMIFGRVVLDEIGVFDPLLGPGTRCRAADDTDLIYRAFKAGVPVHYRPELRIAHNHGRRDVADGERLEHAYTVSIGAMALKHLLRGRLDVVRAAYWRYRSTALQKHQNEAAVYASGALAYLTSTVQATLRQPAPLQKTCQPFR